MKKLVAAKQQEIQDKLIKRKQHSFARQNNVQLQVATHKKRQIPFESSQYRMMKSTTANSTSPIPSGNAS